MLGFPEARIPLAAIVVDMAISPKSNTTMVALDEALMILLKVILVIFQDMLITIPKDSSRSYHYPHEEPTGLNDQKYLPEKYFIKNITSQKKIPLMRKLLLNVRN